jgi:tetratricopeptide (TPR) repeat protein
MGTFGASWSASGLGDLALYEGRLSDAMQIFERGAAVDLAAKNTGNAALKLAALAYVHLVRGQTGAAVAAAEQALLVKSNSGTIRFEAARVLAQAGAIARARSEAARISLGLFVSSGLTGAGGLAVKPEAYAKIIEAEIALSNEDSREAIKLLTEGNTLADTWLGHFDLGLAYLKVPAFAKANAEFDICLKRRGEAIALIDEDPTYGLFPPVLYYQGVAREGLNRADSAESFRAYMDIRGKSTEDPLMQKLRQRFRP